MLPSLLMSCSRVCPCVGCLNFFSQKFFWILKVNVLIFEFASGAALLISKPFTFLPNIGIIFLFSTCYYCVWDFDLGRGSCHHVWPCTRIGCLLINLLWDYCVWEPVSSLYGHVWEPVSLLYGHVCECESVCYDNAVFLDQSAREDIQRLHAERKQLLIACDELSSKRDLAAEVPCDQERVGKRYWKWDGEMLGNPICCHDDVELIWWRCPCGKNVGPMQIQWDNGVQSVLTGTAQNVYQPRDQLLQYCVKFSKSSW